MKKTQSNPFVKELHDKDKKAYENNWAEINVPVSKNVRKFDIFYYAQKKALLAIFPMQKLLRWGNLRSSEKSINEKSFLFIT